MKDQLKAWAERQDPKPSRIGGLEDFYTSEAIEELRTRTDLDQDTGGIPGFSEGVVMAERSKAPA
jgi:hypothetical protein